MVHSPAVEVRGLVKSYDGRTVVDGLDLTAQAGSVTAVLGPNGAGKTTTVECCEGLRSPDAGRVRVLGLDPVADAAALRPRVGVMLQDGGLPSGVRAREMLDHVARMYAHPLGTDALAARLGLDAFARTTVRRLSGGQRQRLALAVAVVGRPRVVFLDEPSAGMDPQARLAVWELVRELRDEGVAVILTTHVMEEAEDLADHVVVVDHGRVIAQGTVADLLAGGGGGPAGGAGAAGGPRVTLVVRTERAVDVADLRGALDDALAVEQRSATTLAVTGAVGPRTLADVTAWLAARDVLATRLDLGRRTLEDVFLDLTGRSLR
ncbi:ABC transporter ATP-binding protein [Cellulomonas shaoxiangyii]|uniref:ABC transporter ATP-binding protein n=1 Tax=Cellulomonas shaoxiangyii TaxID=2566013 RepID=A0A4P7SHW3_9CELL|nr:ABC transporter ATP-binding protein [Cellulomonas shaoxiangyii]QCB93829.1 ABC transporter ATP-binding protein [Cellulomonas shaoxiangyii]TGY84477.1 ABC transporter ATP-binding protein [Cellulomonas shaoxiangyii]